MTDEPHDHYTDAECAAELDRLFPHGPAGRDVMDEIAPAGWAASPLRAVFHPGVEQRYAEAVQFHEGLLRLRSLGGKRDAEPPPPPPTLEEVRAAFVDAPDEPERECAELVGLCLWDIFSDNHEVVAPDGRLLDLGSFRGSAGFLAEWINHRLAVERYDYMDFYMGTIWVARRADIGPVYEMIFRRLRARELDWVYHFPRLGVVDVGPLRQANEEPSGADWHGYDPSAALAREQEQAEREEKLKEFRADLDRANRVAAEEARRAPPPPTVLAYQRAYGRLPRGWPPAP